jgi:uncharacterized protein (UPF0303 family)
MLKNTNNHTRNIVNIKLENILYFFQTRGGSLENMENMVKRKLEYVGKTQQNSFETWRVLKRTS